jgi:hypothetical protein
MSAMTVTPTAVRRPDYRHAAGTAQRGIALASLLKSEADLQQVAELPADVLVRYDLLVGNCRAWANLCRDIQGDAEFLAHWQAGREAAPDAPADTTPADVYLEADETAVLRWLADHPRPVHDCPAGMQFSMAAVCRRRLLKLGLVAALPDHPDYVYTLTAAGTAYLKANDLLPAPSLAFTAGPITVSESAGWCPQLYLIGPPAAPFEGLPGNGPVLATMASTNPNMRGDALLWAHAWETRQALADLLDAVTTGRGVGARDVELNNAVHQAAKVLEKTAG